MKNGLASCVVLALASALVGCVTPTQSASNSEVDRLCAIDGGVRVYEKVAMASASRKIPSKAFATSSDPYFYEWIVSSIKDGNPHYGGGLRIEKSHTRYFRKSDQKLLGEQVIYSRVGGDIPGPWHPSVYSCPDLKNIPNIEKLIFTSGGEK